MGYPALARRPAADLAPAHAQDQGHRGAALAAIRAREGKVKGAKKHLAELDMECRVVTDVTRAWCERKKSEKAGRLFRQIGTILCDADIPVA